MTQKEYREADTRLLEELFDYQASNADLELEISANNKRIADIEHKRLELWKRYNGSEMTQRGLCGNEIQKQ